LSAVCAVYKFPPPDFSRGINGEASFQSSQEDRVSIYIASQGVMLGHVLSTVGCVLSFRYQDMPTTQTYHPLPQLFIWQLFYTQGYFAQRWRPSKWSQQRTEWPSSYQTYKKVYEFSLTIVTFLVMFLGRPIDDWEYPAYPVYSASFRDSSDLFPVTYVLVTWVLIGVFYKLFQAYAEKVKFFGDSVQKHAGESTFIVYIFHYVFLKPFVYFIVRDWGLTYGLWRSLIPPLAFFLSVSGGLGVYALVLKFQSVGEWFDWFGFVRPRRQ
jgi:hypothetical protein